MNHHKKLALLALENMRGDDLHRARAMFSRFTYEEMQEPHGDSGQTRAEILDDYVREDAEISAAIAWLRGLE